MRQKASQIIIPIINYKVCLSGIFMLGIHLYSAMLTNYVFSMATTLLIVYGIEKLGEDPGSPGIILFGQMCSCAVLGIVTAIAMGVAKSKFHKVFPAKYSALIFIFTYFPFHILGLYVSDDQLGVLAAPLAAVSVIMLYFSYIPFYHMTAQGLANFSEYVTRQKAAKNWRALIIAFGSLGAVVLLVGWLVFKPEAPRSPIVLSLNDNWERLEPGGRGWQSDAYLNDVVFYPSGGLPCVIEATYLSKSFPDEVFRIDFNREGEIVDEQTRAATSMRENAKLPIEREDWEVDSIQAWNIFSRLESVRLCLDPSEESVSFFLRLDRIVSGKLAWELTIVGCSAVRNWTSYLLDAKTGETIGSYID